MNSFKMIMGSIILTAALLLAGCGGQDSGDNSSGSESNGGSENGLTEFQMENGIGPVTSEMELGEIDKALAKKGESLFDTKCSACHKLDERYVGPAQRDLVERRTPEYIMNMILNPAEMLEKHPEAEKMLAEFMTPMPNQNLSRDEARSILEYFRYMDKHKDLQEVQ